MSVPKKGVYISEKNAFKIVITKATPSNGNIEGVYEAAGSPQGSFKSTGYAGGIGKYFWVTHGGGVATPFCISFKGVSRPQGRPYCTVDQWNGYYVEGDTMVLTGTRAYVDNTRKTISTSLGTLTFKWVQA